MITHENVECCRIVIYSQDWGILWTVDRYDSFLKERLINFTAIFFLIDQLFLQSFFKKKQATQHIISNNLKVVYCETKSKVKLYSDIWKKLENLILFDRPKSIPHLLLRENIMFRLTTSLSRWTHKNLDLLAFRDWCFFSKHGPTRYLSSWPGLPP